MDYEIRDINLAPSGRQRIEWVRHNMPLLTGLKEKYGALPDEEKPFAGVRISLSIHLEPKTAYLCEVLAAAGAAMSVTGCNPLSTQDDTAAALAESGMRVYAVHGESEEDYFRHIERTLEHRPHIVIDDGGDLAACLHGKRPDLAEEVRGGGEETTTGIIRLKALASDGRLKYPVVAVNDARCKHLFDNRYGTGQSVWDSILRNTNLIVASKTVVVAGYGWCGRGIAMRAAALGASVIVTEIDPVKAIEARMDGYQVMTMFEAAPLGDLFISATGCKDVITLEHMTLMKDRVILANAGHFNVEVDVMGLEARAERSYEARANIMAYVLPGGKTVHVMAEGRLVNIAAADGHPAEIMDMSFAVQFLSALYIQENYEKLPKDVIDVSSEIDTLIAEHKLAAWGVEIDKLTPEQEHYLSSWEL
ncbi:MAG: adenosylhomocysteinase [Clostridiales Family XIII bacterium]|jgi:adenosylhomocysteinase|nr:adenosylhomocysteinase [Clostridiales Family XIII bacterium]